MGSSSSPLHHCRWDFCASSFPSPIALRDHLRVHWQQEEPQRVRVKRAKIASGQWEAIPEEPNLAARFPLRYPGDTTTTTEGTTLSYPYPPSFPSQPPALPLFLPAEDDDDLYEESSHSQRVRRSREARGTNVPPHFGAGPSSQASASSRPVFGRPSQESPGTQISQIDFEQIPGLFDGSFESSSGSRPASGSASTSAKTGTNVHFAGGQEDDEWGCFLGTSPDEHGQRPTSSPFVAPTQPRPTQKVNHTSQRPDIDGMGPDQDTKPDITRAQDSAPSRPMGKPFIAPRSTRPGPSNVESSPQKLPSPTKQVDSSNSSSEASGSTPSWLGNSPNSHPKPHEGIGQGRPSEHGSRLSSNSSQGSHQKSDSYSQSKVQFGMPLSQGSDKAMYDGRRVSSGGSPGVGFSWGQTR